jgi:peptidoglycan/xylan/chitin deacetylase (PgdA/CDA1 family)
VNRRQLKEMAEQGHEIGAHTRTHARLTELTPEDQAEEIRGSREDLIKMGLGLINSFSYPYGAYNIDIIKIVKDSGFSNAVSVIDGYISHLSNKFELEGESLVVTTTFDQIKDLIDQAEEGKKWLMLELHEVNDSGKYYSVSEAIFGQTVDYILQKGIRVVTVDEAIESLEVY